MSQENHARDADQPKHRQVYEHLQRAITSGEYKIGDRVPSEAALVKQFDISRPTVARALRDLEASKLVQRRHGSGTYVIYSPETKGGVLGLLIPGLGQGEIFEPICNRVAQSVQAHNYSLLWGDFSSENHSREVERSEALCRHYIDNRVAGVFFQPIEFSERMKEASRHIVELLEDAGIPIVLIDADFADYPARSRFDLVGIDNRRAGYTLTQHLLQLGRRRIEFVGRSKSASTIDARIEGYQTALFENEIIPQRDWIHRVETIDETFVKSILEAGPPQAIVCGTDFTAAEVMRDLLKLGVRVPHDIAVVGVDDLKYANALSVPLTTIRQPCVAMADAAVDTMIWRISNPSQPPRTVLLDFELVVRESCGNKPATKPQGDSFFMTQHESDYRRVADASETTRFLDGSAVEIIRFPKRKQPPRYALFDFDGTLSLIREGWPEVMVPMMVEALQATDSDESAEDLEKLANDFVGELTGKQTIYQMIRLVDEIEKRGGQAEEPTVYKRRYDDLLMKRIGDRRETLRTGQVDAESMLVPGSIELLDELARRGVQLYLASGTDEQYVIEEVRLLGLDKYFGPHIYGAQEDYKSFSKAMVIERILKENNVPGELLLGFGDGYVEIQNVKEAGGIGVGVASNESERNGKPDLWKRDRLIGVGADIVVPDFGDWKPLVGFIWGE